MGNCWKAHTLLCVIHKIPETQYVIRTHFDRFMFMFTFCAHTIFSFIGSGNRTQPKFIWRIFWFLFIYSRSFMQTKQTSKQTSISIHPAPAHKRQIVCQTYRLNEKSNGSKKIYKHQNNHNKRKLFESKDIISIFAVSKSLCYGPHINIRLMW